MIHSLSMHAHEHTQILVHTHTHTHTRSLINGLKYLEPLQMPASRPNSQHTAAFWGIWSKLNHVVIITSVDAPKSNKKQQMFFFSFLKAISWQVNLTRLPPSALHDLKSLHKLKRLSLSEHIWGDVFLWKCWILRTQTPAVTVLALTMTLVSASLF